jgi:hypothetical protein
MNTFKRFYFSLEALLLVSLLFVFVSLLTIPAGLYFIVKGRYLGWADVASEKLFNFIDLRFEGLSKSIKK